MTTPQKIALVFMTLSLTGTLGFLSHQIVQKNEKIAILEEALVDTETSRIQTQNVLIRTEMELVSCKKSQARKLMVKNDE